jgi:cyclophilin family peptidyl-prolyl cis-trans isomerase
MTIRAIVLVTAMTLFAAVSAHVPAVAANLGDPASLKEKAPAVYKAKFDTSKGTFVIEVHRDWAPNGADRFYNLVKNGFYDDARFFRVIDGFMVQFGISGNPDLSALWREARIPDDRVKQSNTRGTVSFATAGPNTRTTQVFINFGDNAGLDGQGFSPFGEVVSGMDVVDSFFKGYGEGAPRGAGPDQAQIQARGNAYLITKFPKLDYVKKATIEQ